MTEYAPEESEYNKSFLYTEVLISLSDYTLTHFPLESWNSYSNKSYYPPVENNFAYPTLTQQLLFMNLLNNRNHDNYYYNNDYYYYDDDYTASENEAEESDNAEKQKPYMIFIVILVLVVGLGFFLILLR